MSTPPFMPWYLADYFGATKALTVEQHGAYLILLSMAWEGRGRIPNDLALIRREFETRAIPMHGRHFNSLVAPLLDRYFYIHADGFLHNLRLDLEQKKSANFSLNQREKSLKRWGRQSPINELNDPAGMPARPRTETLTKNLTTEVRARGNVPDYSDVPLGPTVVGFRDGRRTTNEGKG
jgi:uncharacterized protein YdaU (DUF1376 family)